MRIGHCFKIIVWPEIYKGNFLNMIGSKKCQKEKENQASEIKRVYNRFIDKSSEFIIGRHKRV